MDKCIFVLLLFAAWALGERGSWRRRDRKIKVWIAAFGLAAAYLSVRYLFHPDWPGYGELLKLAFGPVTRSVLGWLGTSA